jgi:hypothetical protein
MHAEVQKILDAAMERTSEYGAMLQHNRNLLEAASRPGSDTPAKTVESIADDAAEYKTLYQGALGVLAHVLDAAGYDVREPVPFPDGNPFPSLPPAEAELKKWLEGKKAQATA